MLATNILILAATIFLEAAGEPFDGKLAVASVIHNRANGNSEQYSSVCLKPKQFSCWNSGIDSQTERVEKRISTSDVEEKAWKQCMIIAQSMYRGKFESTTIADHYFTTSIEIPTWAKNMTHIETIKNHTFYRSKN